MSRKPQPVVDLPGEEWRSVVGYEGRYEVSSMGRVRSYYIAGHQIVSISPQRICCLDVAQDGYHRIELRRDGTARKFYVHDLLLFAFVGPCPSGMMARHLDGTRTNNIPGNLEWATAKDNQGDRVRHGTHIRGERCPHAKLTHERVAELRILCATGQATQEIAGRMFGLPQQQVSKIIRGVSYKDAGGPLSRTSGRLDGEYHPRAKLTQCEVDEIRNLLASGAEQQILAARFSVRPSTISNINCGKTWVRHG